MVAASPVRALIGTGQELTGAPVVIERTTLAGIEDRRMSRRHATVEKLGSNEVEVRDGADWDGEWKESANGTWIGDDEVLTPTRVPVGGTFRTGHTLWMVVQNPGTMPENTLLHGISESVDRARDEIELVTSQVALRLDTHKRVTQALLVTGPRGTGKMIVAREAHRLLSEKRRGNEVPFRQVSAPTLSDGTVAADLFGVVSGYATDVKGRPGYFEQADGGILLLDEVGDTPAAEQAKLLTVLQEREVVPLGGRRATPFDCLVVAATNRDLSGLSAGGQFRADLLDRLGRFVVHLPALDDRREDIPFVARELFRRHGYEGPLGYRVVLRLLERRWPGNIRELDALIERVTAVIQRERLDDLDIQTLDRVLEDHERRQPASQASSTPAVKPIPANSRGRPSRAELLQALEETGWNKSEVGRRYGKAPRQVTRWMEYLDIERPE